LSRGKSIDSACLKNSFYPRLLLLYNRCMSDSKRIRILRHIDAISAAVQRQQEQKKTAICDHVRNVASAVEKARTQARSAVDEYIKGGKSLVDVVPLDYFAPLRGTFYERAHTMMLGFFLDRPKVGDFATNLLMSILWQVLERGNCSEFDKKLIDKTHAQMKIKALVPSSPIIEGGLGNRGSGRLPDIKIALEGTETPRLVIIENKVFSPEGQDQTPKYVRATSHKTIGRRDCRNCIGAKNNPSRDPICEKNGTPSHLYIYLDLKAQLPSCSRFALCDYKMLGKAFKLAGESQGLVSPHVKMLASAYHQTLEKLCKGHEFTLDDLAPANPVDCFPLRKLLYLQKQIAGKESRDKRQN